MSKHICELKSSAEQTLWLEKQIPRYEEWQVWRFRHGNKGWTLAQRADSEAQAREWAREYPVAAVMKVTINKPEERNT